MFDRDSRAVSETDPQTHLEAWHPYSAAFHAAFVKAHFSADTAPLSKPHQVQSTVATICAEFEVTSCALLLRLYVMLARVVVFFFMSGVRLGHNYLRDSCPSHAERSLLNDLSVDYRVVLVIADYLNFISHSCCCRCCWYSTLQAHSTAYDNTVS